MKNIILTICVVIVFTQFNRAQISVDFPCYTVATNNGQSNVLFELDQTTNQWFQVGATGTNFLEAIAIDAISGIIYAAEGSGGSHGINGAFGIIDRTTGNFEKIGETGIGNGAFGPINLNNIDGLTFDPVNQIMYATHRVEGDSPGTNDLLFQIDLSTGGFLPGAMIDNTTGFPVDYAVIPEILEGDFGEDVYNVSDIAYNSYSGQLFAIQTQDARSIITEIEPQSGDVIDVIYDLEEEYVEGLGFTQLGELFATTGNDSSSFLYLDIAASQTIPLFPIDVTGENTGFGSFDCDLAKNDLALEITLDSSTVLPIQPGDLVTCVITIHNQGDLENIDITLTNYTPSGLTLADANWIDTPNGTAVNMLTESLLSGESTTINITLKVDNSYNGGSLTNSVEITSSFNPSITDNYGNALPLPDVDSVPNDLNDEINIVDNEINGGGPDAGEDEDDHDIVLLNFNNGIANILNLTGLIDGGTYLAGQTIISNGQLKSSSTVLFKAGSEIILNKGFTIENNTFFDAEIGKVE